MSGFATFSQSLQHRLNALAGIALVTLALTACKPSPNSTETVSWPQLSVFDEESAKAEGLAQVGDLEALRQLLPELIATGSAVTRATVPNRAKNPAGLTAPLTDLDELITKLSADTLNDEDLTTYTLALHPLVALMMAEAGMPHVHANEGPHGGYYHPVFSEDGKQAATLEIKLHDDAGDLEVWLQKGGRDGGPLGLDLDDVLSLEFPELNKTVELKVRDRETNAGEDGDSNIHQGKTHYFIFPGETGADAQWLMGEAFAAKARLSAPGGLSTEVFVLKPHVHHE
jgi:hypothetical protein